MVYFDDILIYSTNLDVHLQHLREVLIVLRRDKFFADIAKCLFMTDSILFLGYVVSKDGLSVDESTVVKQWPLPITLQEVRSFHGLVSFYLHFIHNFNIIMAAIMDTATFEVIKEKLTTAPILTLPDSSQPFELHCNASKLGIGAVLSQGRRPVAYFSEKLRGSKLTIAYMMWSSMHWFKP
jgi:hypothetical protein